MADWNISDYFATAKRFQEALVTIARGRTDNGRPLGGRTAQEVARLALIDRDRSWSVSERPDAADLAHEK